MTVGFARRKQAKKGEGLFKVLRCIALNPEESYVSAISDRTRLQEGYVSQAIGALLSDDMIWGWWPEGLPSIEERSRGRGHRTFYKPTDYGICHYVAKSREFPLLEEEWKRNSDENHALWARRRAI